MILAYIVTFLLHRSGVNCASLSPVTIVDQYLVFICVKKQPSNGQTAEVRAKQSFEKGTYTKESTPKALNS